ncbi:MAG: YidC/Oxa1 family membrane protein insertase, partial [Treponema sp.]|nr:YidC/Oxa1 family membrane protein insertase [Treponema sp.]
MLHFLYNMIIFPIYLIIQVAYLLSLIIFGNNHGLAIILISVLVTILCLPLYIVAEKWQQIEREKQNSMKEMLSVIKSAFKGDERYMMTNAYYKQEHYHPIMALRSSFGLLIQIPFFIAAYKYLSTSAGLLGNSFLFIKDLG